VLAKLQEGDDEPGRINYREISLEEAAARWMEALEMTDMTLDPPTSEDLDRLRALVMVRLSQTATRREGSGAAQHGRGGAGPAPGPVH